MPQSGQYFYNQQSGAGKGTTQRYGPKPPSPDEVAPRGTPQWKAAWKAQDDWVKTQMSVGATLNDMGFRDEKELGKHMFQRAMAGDFEGVGERTGWLAANADNDRFTYRPNDTTAYNTGQKWGSVARSAIANNTNAKEYEQYAAYRNGGTGTGEDGAPDLWPGNSGMEGSLPQYAAPQYNPVDSWGGWSGVYGNQANPNVTQSNPAGMSSPVLQPPASIGQVSSQQQMGSTGAAPASIGRQARRRRNPTQGGSFGAPTNGIMPQGMLIRR